MEIFCHSVTNYNSLICMSLEIETHELKLGENPTTMATTQEGYLREKFLQAVYDLCSEGDIKSRVEQAHGRFWHIEIDEFSEVPPR